eukprot:862074_1
MIDSCSLTHIVVDSSKIDVDLFIVGSPIISQVKDITNMPQECPIISGTIQSTELCVDNKLHIELDAIDIGRIFSDADVEEINSTAYEIPDVDTRGLDSDLDYNNVYRLGENETYLGDTTRR